MGRGMPWHPDPPPGRRARRLILAALLAILLVPTASAGASAFTAVQQVFAQGQTIPPCEFSSSELNQAQSSVPADSQEYSPELIAAIDLARQERADGACSTKQRRGATTPAPSAVATPGPPPAPPLGRPTPLHLGSPTAATDSGLPAPIAILELLGVLVLASGAALGTVRLLGRSPAWATRASHAWTEAGYRFSGIWSEFGDRWRPGR